MPGASEQDRQAILRSAPGSALGEFDGREIWGILHDAYEPIDTGDRVVSAQVLTFRVSRSDALGFRRGLPIAIAGKPYRLEDGQHDIAGYETWTLSNAQ